MHERETTKLILIIPMFNLSLETDHQASHDFVLLTTYIFLHVERVRIKFSMYTKSISVEKEHNNLDIIIKALKKLYLEGVCLLLGLCVPLIRFAGTEKGWDKEVGMISSY